jgi:hypothetical protein
MNTEYSNTTLDNGSARACHESMRCLQFPYYAIVTAISHFSKDRHAAIAERAYFRAERRGFAPGHDLDDCDWRARQKSRSGFVKAYPFGL